MSKSRIPRHNMEKENVKVQASSRPPNSCYGVFVNNSGVVVDKDTKEKLKFETYNDALEGLRAMKYTFWSPSSSQGSPPNNSAYVCYVDLPPKQLNNPWADVDCWD